MGEENKLTDEQVEMINQEMEDSIKGTPLEDIAAMPSNNGVDERDPETIEEEGEEAIVTVQVNPETGEETIINEEPVKEMTIDDFINNINEGTSYFDSTSIEKADFMKTVNDKDNKDLFFNNFIEDNVGIKEENVEKIIDIMNRRSEGENFNVYRELPEEVQNMINASIATQVKGMPVSGDQIRQFRNALAESIIDDYIVSIREQKAKHDFADELASMYNTGKSELTQASLEYTEARNKAYREGADKITDPEKKARYLEIMDAIDEALNLTQLKEYAKKCKIKQIELEKPQRIVQDFLQKYQESDKNIYNLSMVSNFLYRALKADGYDPVHITALIIAFVKQVKNYRSENAVEHAYMYYFIYYCVFVDNQSNNFKENIKEVINNLIERNSSILYPPVPPTETESEADIDFDFNELSEVDAIDFNTED